MDVAEDVQKTFSKVMPVIHTVESYLITNGVIKAYAHINLDRVKYLGVVIDSDEARQTSDVIELLEWLAAIGIKKFCLYDREGVLKKSKEVYLEKFSSENLSNEDLNTDPLLSKKQMTFEFISASDGKEAVSKAANLLFEKHYLNGDTEKPFFTETYLTGALKTLGSVEPDPDLLLIYGPARCHLGFPAWRIRYTEMTYGAVEVQEIWFNSKSHSQIHESEAKLRFISKHKWLPYGEIKSISSELQNLKIHK